MRMVALRDFWYGKQLKAGDIFVAECADHAAILDMLGHAKVQADNEYMTRDMVAERRRPGRPRLVGN